MKPNYNMNFKKACTILSVNEDCSFADVKEAYINLAKKYHPDVCNDIAANDIMQKINEAYDYLKEYFRNCNTEQPKPNTTKKDVESKESDLNNNTFQNNFKQQKDINTQKIYRQKKDTDHSIIGQIIHGVLATLCLIAMIVMLCSGFTGVGICYGIMIVPFLICCIFYNYLNGKRVMGWIIFLGLIIAIPVTIPMWIKDEDANNNTSANYTSSYTTETYTITFDKDKGVGGSDSVEAKLHEAMPFATAPTREGYDFGGYFFSEDGIGTQYYSSNMSSKHDWNFVGDRTLYALWIAKDGRINLTKENFDTYFSFTSDCNINSATTATYEYTIFPKDKFNYTDYPDNPDIIIVTIGLNISPVGYYFGEPTLNKKITVILAKSAGYSYSGSETYSISSEDKYWIDRVFSVDGEIYSD